MAQDPADNYTTASTQFALPVNGGDNFDRLDNVTDLGTAVDSHGHEDTLGLPAARIDFGLLEERPTGDAGSVYIATDTSQMFYHDGGDWSELVTAPVLSAEIADGAVTQAKLGTDTLRTMQVRILGGENVSVWARSGVYAECFLDDEGPGYGPITRFVLDKSRLPDGASVKFNAVISGGNPFSVTGYFRLYNRTLSEAVAGSEVSAIMPYEYEESGNIAEGLASGVNEYCIQGRRDPDENPACSCSQAWLRVEW